MLNRQYSLIFLLALSALAIGADSCDKKDSPTYKDWGELTALDLNNSIEGWRTRNKVTGMAVAVYNQGNIYSNGYGRKDKTRKVEADKTLFRLASVSKTVNATLAYTARDLGLLNIDMPVTDYYPEYQKPAIFLDGTQTSAKAITLRHLLSHTAGIQHYSNGITSPEPPDESTRKPNREVGFEFALDYWMANPLLSEVGSKYSYSTFGPNLAGVVIERAIQAQFPNLTWESAIKTWINMPLGIESLYIDYEGEPDSNKSHGFDSSGKKVSSTDVSWKAPGGGLISTADDMAKFCGGLVSGNILTEESREDMWKKMTLDNGTQIAATQGFFIKNVNGRQVIEHSGAQNKARSYLVLHKESQTCVVVLTNANFSVPVIELGRDILNLVLDLIDSENNNNEPIELPQLNPLELQNYKIEIPYEPILFG